jgi:hypothetical protein
MKLVSLVVLSFALLVALSWPPAAAHGAAPADAEPGLCAQMTPEAILAAPQLAERWDRAVRSADPAEIARMHALAAEVRAAHGCDPASDGDGDPGAALPPGHPPIHADGLPPGHPPIDGNGLPPGHPRIPAAPSLPLFEAPAVLTI